MVPYFFNEHDISSQRFFIVPHVQTRPIFPHENSTRKNMPNKILMKPFAFSGT